MPSKKRQKKIKKEEKAKENCDSEEECEYEDDENDDVESPCDYCGETGDVHRSEIFGSPFDESGDIVNICEECEDDSVFICDECDRLIEKSCGMRINYKIVGDELICVRCYQKRALENGQPKSDFTTTSGSLAGDFYDYEDLENAGFQKVESYSAGMLPSGRRGMEDVARLKEKALELIKKGKKVIVNIDSASIIGSGAYFSLWAK